MCIISRVALSIAIAVFCAASFMFTGSFALAQDKPHAKVIAFEKTGDDVQPLLSGPPETVTMKSGFVTLAPGKSVGKHTTGQHEEMLVILTGRGEMIFHDGSKLEISANHALYCPPDTEHDVRNTGTDTLRYVYVVSSTK